MDRHSDDDSPAVIRPTSGTTGAVPKLVVMPHRQLTWRLRAPAFWETPADTFYLPMRNHFAVVDVCYVLCSGATLVLSWATSPAQIDVEMARHQASVLLTIPSLLGLLASQKEPPPALRLKAMRTSAATLPSDVRAAAEQRYGAPVVQMYGSTEGGFAFATNPNDTPPDSIGKPLAHVEARLIDEHGNAVKRGEPGELVVRTPGMMLGYLDDPLATSTVLRDGWLWTGDLARQDHAGFYYLLGRRDGRVTSSGFKVLPEEIEAVLATHPGVLEVAVMADPDAVRGHTVRAVVVAKAPAPTAAELTRFCRERLAAYKVPRKFDFVDQLPRTPVGKIRRSQLRHD